MNAKTAAAVSYLKSRGIYCLDKGTPNLLGAHPRVLPSPRSAHALPPALAAALDPFRPADQRGHWAACSCRTNPNGDRRCDICYGTESVYVDPQGVAHAHGE